MQRFQNTYTAGAVPGPSTGDWQAEISGSGTAGIHAQDAAGQMPERTEFVSMPGGQMVPMGNMPGIRTNLPEDVIQNPLSVEETHKGSIKAMLTRDEGN